MTDREPNASIDQENAPLLRDDEHEDFPSESTFQDRLNALAQEPLTPLTKLLLIFLLVLLLLASIFVGLFAGAQHQLKLERGKGKTTVTLTATTTATHTTTAISSATYTSTTITTTTFVPPPIPIPTAPPESKICLEPSCIVLSASILSSLDPSQDPCESFYDFANGGWLREHPLPADKSSYGNFEYLAQQNKQVIRTILETNYSVASIDDQILNKLRDFYGSCLDEKKQEEVGVTPLLHIVNTIRKLLSGNDTEIAQHSTGETRDRRGLTSALAFLHSRGIGGLFSFSVEGDVGVDPNHMLLWFSQPDLGLPSKEYYDEDSIVTIYKSVIERLLVTLWDEQEVQYSLDAQSLDSAQSQFTVDTKANNWPPWPWPPWGGDDEDKDHPKNKSEQARKLASKVFSFEKQLADASLDLDILYQDPIATYNPVKLSNISDTLTQIHFPTYFASFTPRVYPERIIVTYPAYIQSLSEILDDTSKDVLEAYLVIRAALHLSPYLAMNTEAWKAQRTLHETLNGLKKGAIGDRAEYCIGKVEDVLGFASGRYFVLEKFPGDSKKKGTKVITDIVAAFKESLKAIDWMDEASEKAAAAKADAIRVKVGYPTTPNTEDPRSVARYYAGVKIHKDDFFGNILSSATYEEFRKWLQLGRRRDPNTWEMYPSTVNAYFNPPANEIVFPAGILQPPFFSQDWHVLPNYLAYGAFGQVASHELTHAFDSAGRLYNQDGKLVQWWTNATSDGFKEKQDCIVKQYSSYSIDDGKGGRLYVNGNLTSGENIGDTGLIQSYRAWKAQYHVSERNGNEYLLPGLNFTREQLFFISFARIWARAMKPAAAIMRIRTDPHSPSRFRVDGTVSNIPEFAEAFKCSKKAKLNPPNKDRCIFWG